MSKDLSRRSVLTGVGCAAAGTLAAMLPRELWAAQPAAPAAPRAGGARAGAAPAAAPAPIKDIVLTMLYPNGQDLKFDADAFRDRHVAVLQKSYVALERIELRVPPAATAEGVQAPPMLAAVSMWISDFNKFAANAGANAKEVAASMATITNSRPMAQLDRFVAGLGAERGSVMANARCLTQFFEAKADAKWDAKLYADNYLRKLMAALGPEAAQRIEVLKGEQATDGSKALMLGSVNIYYTDAEKFFNAMGTESVKVVADEEKNFFTSPPIQTLFLVHSVA